VGERYQLPLGKRISIGARATLIERLLHASRYLPASFLQRVVRRLAGRNRYPMGQRFIEQGLTSLGRALAQANPRCRKKLIRNLAINQGVWGQALRNWITKQLGYEIQTFLVISPTMRCPLRCYGCYSGEYDRSSDMDVATFDRVLGEARAMGNYFVVVSGGEPFLYKGLFDLARKYDDVFFMVYTSGVTLDPEGTARLAEVGNILPCLSVEGFEAETDARRGKGHFKRLLAAFANLRVAGVPFGFSCTATRLNNDLITSDEFVRFVLEQGAVLGWYFQYMPIGREPALDLVPTPEQRMARLQRLREMRTRYDVLIADFWNDGPLVGGCMAGARRYLHINNAGDVEPCVFCQLTTDSVHEKSLLEILRSSRLLTAIRKRQPYSDNLLRPCLMIDNPEALKEVVAEANPRETCSGGARRLVTDLYPQMQDYAARWRTLADGAWTEHYADQYKETLIEAHRLTDNFTQHHPTPTGQLPITESSPPAAAPAVSTPATTSLTETDSPAANTSPNDPPPKAA
jgi:MoaA/NifB/PqqE/SkfB family radical SAM enzyme